MSSKFFLGQKLKKFTKESPFNPVDRVQLNISEESFVRAPNVSQAAWDAMTGRIIEADCPYATQAMANALLSTFSGFSYKPYDAQGALIDPAVELGDAITSNGVYSMIVDQRITFDSLFSSEAKAPGDEELDHEYPYVDPVERKFAQVTNKLTTQLSVVDGRITAEVTRATGAESALSSRLTVAEGEITSRITSAQAETLIQQTVDALTLSVVTGSGGTYVKLTGDGVDVQSSTVNLHVKSVNIDGTLTADQIATNISTVNSTLYLGGSSSASGQLVLGTHGNISSISSGMFINSDSDIWNTCDYFLVNADSQISLNSGGNIYIYPDSDFCQIIDLGITDTSIRPMTDGSMSCGASSRRWSAVYAVNGTIQTSDRQQKKDIDYTLDEYEGFFDDLKPVSYKMINGTSGRTHVGLISQDIEDNLTAHGMSAMDFAGFCKDKKKRDIFDEDGHWQGEEEIDGYDYALRYDEFIALCIDQIQKLKTRVQELENGRS